MHPEIFRIGSLPIYSYGLMLVLSFGVGIVIAQKRAASRGLSPDLVLDVSTVILISSIVGSRLLYVLFHVDEFKGHWLDTINITKGLAGLSMFGGIVLAVASTLLYLRRRHVSLWEMSDVLAPSVALGMGITRIGCFLNGCCFGRACDLPWAVSFPPGSVAWSVMGNTHLHPTQLYASLVGFLIFGLVLLIDRQNVPPGTVVWSVFGMYGVARFLMDFLRHYEANNYFEFLGVSLASSQLFSLGFVLVSIAWIIYVRNHP